MLSLNGDTKTGNSERRRDNEKAVGGYFGFIPYQLKTVRRLNNEQGAKKKQI